MDGDKPAAAVKDLTVRSVPVDACDTMAAAARRAGLSQALWLAEAIREKVAREREALTGEVVASPQGTELVTTPEPDRGHTGMTPDQLVGYLNAYTRVMELRGKSVPPRGAVLTAAERMIKDQFGIPAPAPGKSRVSRSKARENVSISPT